MIVLGILVGLLVLTLLVVGHEFGHFIMARRNGVKVNEFGIGFYPRAIAWVKNPKTKKWERLPKKDWDKPQEGLIFSLNWLPIGGFCAMDGESDADTRPHTFGASTFWQKTKILFGGVAMNWLMAFVILTILAWTGMPKFISNQFFLENDQIVDAKPVLVKEVVEGSPAEKAGLKEGDQIKTMNGETVVSSSSIMTFDEAHAGEEVTFGIVRDQKDENISVKLNDSGSEYILGIAMSQTDQTLYRATWSAPIVGLGTTAQLTGETFKGFGQLIGNLFSGVFRQFSPDESTREQGRQDIGAVGDSVSGPVGIIGTLFPAFTEAGPTNVAFLAALVSISLACMNVLPIPALDGGRWLLIAIFRLRKKPLTTEVEGKIVSRAFIFLIGLTVIITLLDILRLFK